MPADDNWRRTLAALTVAQALTMIAFSFVFPFFPLYVQELGIHDTALAAQWAGAIIAGTAVSMAVAQPIWGSVSDRHGRKPMLLRSMLGGCITISLMGLVASVEQLLVLRFIQGAVTGSVAAGNTLAAATVPRRRLGFALGLMQVAFFIGTSAGPLIGGMIADRAGYRVPFYAAGALMFVGFLIVLFFVKERFIRPERGEERTGFWSESRVLMAMSIFPVLMGVAFLIQFGGVIVSPILSLFIVELSGGDNPATTAGIVFAGTGATSAISALMLGRVGDRIGHHKILGVCLLGAAATYVPQAFVTQVSELMILRTLLGAFLGGLMPSANALMATMVPPDRRGTAFGLSSASQSLANAVGPMTGALVATHWGIRTIFVGTGALFLIAYGWVWAAFRKPQAASSGISPKGS